jgi:hypothetical protein
MFYVVAGVVLGLLVSVGPWSAIGAPFDWIAAGLVDVSSSVVGTIAGAVPATPRTAEIIATIAAALSAMAPGLTARMIIAGAQAGPKARQPLAVFAIVVSVVALIALPFWQAFAVAATAAVIGALPHISRSALVSVPLVMIATVTAVRYSITVWTGKAAAVESGTASLAQVSHGMNPLWQLALTAAALAPIGWIVAYLFRDNTRKK